VPSGQLEPTPSAGRLSNKRRQRLDAAIRQIREYTAKHSELRAAHHFCYDLPLCKDAGTPEVVVIGINPGETARDRDAYLGPTEETWNHDFHEAAKSGPGPARNNYHRNARFFADGKAVVFTEFFLWSSGDSRVFRQRFGRLWRSPHLRFCIEMNRLLIEEYRPKSVIGVGVTLSRKIAAAFDLYHVNTLTCGGSRLVEHYRDQLRPWFFTKHWAGAYGFTNNQKHEIREYIRYRSA